MKKFFSFGTLQSRIYAIFTLMVFASIFIMQLVSFRFNINSVRDSILENNRALLGELTTQVDAYIGDMESVVNLIADDSQIQQYVAGTNEELLPVIQEKLTNYMDARKDISGILLVTSEGEALSGRSGDIISPWFSAEELDWYSSARAARGQTVVSTSYVQNIIKEQYSWVVSLSREILSAFTGEPLGILLVDLKFNRINELCCSLVVGRKSYDFILDSRGNFVFHPLQQLVYSNLRTEPIQEILSMVLNGEGGPFFDGERYFTVDTSAITGWHIVNVTYHSDITTDWQNVQLSYTIIGFFLFLVIGIFTNIISSGITKPVRKLQDIMKSVETGEFHLVGAIEGTDEIRNLAREYDIMVSRIRELMEANTVEQELKRKSDLKALQAQINPHFLYNTLDSIIWMGEMEQNKEVVKMTSALSKLFRISISKGRELITIADEIAHVQSYLTIQEMRYRDKFRYLIDVDPEILDYRVLKITLQPLVENSLYHGIKEVDHQGFLSIKGRREGDEIILEVSDNGKGMDEAQLQKLIRGIEFLPEQRRIEPQGMGMGVRNVHERIRLYFGKGFGLTFVSNPGEGTSITIRLPALTQEVLS